MMKKTFLTLTLMLLSAIALNAQSLTGHRWGTKFTDDDGNDVLVSLTFEKNGTCELFVGAEQVIKEDGVPVDIMGGVYVPGTYTLNGKDLTMNFDKNNAVVDFDYEIKGMDAKTKALMDEHIKSELNGMKGEFKRTMIGGMPKMQNTQIVSLTNNKLVIKDDKGDEIPFEKY